MAVPERDASAKALHATEIAGLVGNALIVETDANYSRFDTDGSLNVSARQAIAEAVLTHGQSGLDNRFDFIVVFTDFPVDLGPGVLGLNWSVSNAVAGIGRPIFDNSSSFSSSRLQSIVDMRNALAEPVSPGGPREDQVLDTLMHELMHQWGSHLRVNLPGLPDEVLLGRDGTHWSALLSTDASVMHGARWQLLADGRARATGASEQYGPLDLYAAGWLHVDELPAITLLQSAELSPEALPEAGIEISATALTIDPAQIVAANGTRLPDSEQSQKAFRGALVLLQRPGQPPAAGLLDRLESFRARAQDRFAALALGRARLDLGYQEPPLEGQSPVQRANATTCGTAGQPLCETGVTGALQWLLATQHVDGYWADKPQTAVLDTVAAVRALQAALPDGDAAIDRALAWLGAAQPMDVEQQSLLLEHGQLDSTAEQSLISQLLQTRDGNFTDPGFGAQGARASSALETARVLSANAALEQRGGQSFELLTLLRNALLARRQNNPVSNPSADEQRCWAREQTGPCDALTAAVALEALVRAGVSPAELSDSSGVLLNSGLDAEGVRVAERLHALQALGLADDPRALNMDASLRAAQRPDGSWAGSVSATAESLRWLLARSLPDLQVVGPITTDLQALTVGLPVHLGWTVRNGGPIDAGTVRMRLEYRPADVPESTAWSLLDEVLTPPLSAGGTADFMLPWDTFGLTPGSYRVRLSVDVDGEVSEVNEQNNQREDLFDFAAPPSVVDLVLVSAQVSPDVLSTVPQPITVQAEAVNIGLAAAP
ncbi:MAG: hypothetical protein KDI51_11180, partial [Xanthomonadales bacterium]|nr:hypothetical protein [Xanthomonadales bacterium]